MLFLCCVILGPASSAQLGLYRSQPYNNIATLVQEPRLTAFADRANRDSEIIHQDNRFSHSVGSETRPVCLSGEHLKTSHNDAVLASRTSRPAAAINGYSLNYTKLPEPKTDNLHSYQNPVDAAMEMNSHNGRSSRRSAIPVSSMLLQSWLYF